MPVNINLLPDEVIARGITPPDIGNFGTAFTGTQDYLQKQREQNLFSGGLPRTPTGDIDYGQVAEMLARVQGTGAIGSLGGLRQGDIQQQVLKGIGQGGGGVFSPPPLPQEQTQFPPSVQRSGGTSQQTSSLEPDERRLRPDQPGNIGGDVIAQTIDDQPTEVPSARSFAPVASTDSRYPAQFQPPTERFTPPAPQAPPQQVAQAQTRPQMQDVLPAPAQAPIPPGSPGFASLENAASYEQMAGRAAGISAALGAAGMAAGAAGYKQQSDHLYDTAKQIREHIGKIGEEREKARLKEGAVLPEAAAKAQVETLAESRKKAANFADGIPATQDLLDQINSKAGIFSGKWANERLALAKIGQLVGLPDDRVTPTESYRALIGRRVASTVKNFGSGTSITNQDREYAEKMEGGDISLNEDSIRRILTLSDQVGRDNIKNHNRDVGVLQREYPQAKLGPFKVTEPPALSGRTTQPKEKPPGVRPQTWTSSKGNTYQINPDGSLAPLSPR